MPKFIFLIIFCFSAVQGFTQVKAENKTDAKGNKQGYWIKTNDKGKKVYEGNFKDDKPIGKFKYYNLDIDSVRIILDFQSDGKTAYSTNFHYNGKLEAKGKYVNQQKDSIWNYYDESSALISTENYSNGKKNGKSVTYDGPNIIEEKTYIDDKMDGPFKQYFGDKKIKGEGGYWNNEFYGKCTFYFPNGQAAATGVYDKGGVKKGVWIYKTKQGKLESKEIWVNGKILNDAEVAEYIKKNKGINVKEEPLKEKTKPNNTNNKKPKGQANKIK